MDLSDIAEATGGAYPRPGELVRVEHLAAIPPQPSALYDEDTPTCALCGRYWTDMRLGHCGCAYCARCVYEELSGLMLSHCPACCGELYPLGPPNESLQSRTRSQKVLCRNHRLISGEDGCLFSCTGADGRTLAAHERECFRRRAEAENRELEEEEDYFPDFDEIYDPPKEAADLLPPGPRLSVQASFVSPTASQLFGQAGRQF